MTTSTQNIRIHTFYADPDLGLAVDAEFKCFQNWGLALNV